MGTDEPQRLPGSPSSTGDPSAGWDVSVPCGHKANGAAAGSGRRGSWGAPQPRASPPGTHRHPWVLPIALTIPGSAILAAPC